MKKKIINRDNLSVFINQYVSFSNFMMRGKKSSAIFVPGCSYMKFGNDILYKTLQILKSFDNFVEISSICCGRPSEVLNENTQIKNEKKLVDFIKKRGVEKIYTSCPNCHKKFVKIGKKYNLNLDVIMIYDLIKQYIYKNDLRYNLVKDVLVIHDPCAIREDITTQNAIRSILEHIGQKYVEPNHNKNKTLCCGNINMLHVVNKEISSKMAKKRIEDLKDKSNMILSYCNGCLYTFSKYGQKTIHIVELIFGKVNKINYSNRILFTLGLKKC